MCLSVVIGIVTQRFWFQVLLDDGIRRLWMMCVYEKKEKNIFCTTMRGF